MIVATLCQKFLFHAAFLIITELRAAVAMTCVARRWSARGTRARRLTPLRSPLVAADKIRFFFLVL